MQTDLLHSRNNYCNRVKKRLFYYFITAAVNQSPAVLVLFRHGLLQRQYGVVVVASVIYCMYVLFLIYF